MNKQEEFKELQEKVDALLKLNKELMDEIGMCDLTHDTGEKGNRGFLQASLWRIKEVSDKYGQNLMIAEEINGGYQWDVSIPSLKIYAIATDRDLKFYGLASEE